MDALLCDWQEPINQSSQTCRTLLSKCLEDIGGILDPLEARLQSLEHPMNPSSWPSAPLDISGIIRIRCRLMLFKGASKARSDNAEGSPRALVHHPYTSDVLWDPFAQVTAESGELLPPRRWLQCILANAAPDQIQVEAEACFGSGHLTLHSEPGVTGLAVALLTPGITSFWSSLKLSEVQLQRGVNPFCALSLSLAFLELLSALQMDTTPQSLNWATPDCLLLKSKLTQMLVIALESISKSKQQLAALHAVTKIPNLCR